MLRATSINTFSRKLDRGLPITCLRPTVTCSKHLECPLVLPKRLAPQMRKSLASAVATDSDVGDSAPVTATRKKEWWLEHQNVWVDIKDEQQFHKVVHESKTDLVLVDFYATWCHGCEKSYPELSKIASDPSLRQNVTFVKVCVDALKQLARAEGVGALPSVLVYRPGEGRLVNLSGAFSKLKFMKPNLRVIMSNPGMAYDVDAYGLVMAKPKRAADVIAEEAERKRREIEELTRSTSSLFSKLLDSLPSAGSKPASKATDSETKASTAAVENGNGALVSGAAVVSVEEELRRKVEVVAEVVGGKSGATVDHALQLEKMMFLNRANGEYGYGGQIDALYDKEVGIRMAPNEHYFDYTGASVYCQSQLDAAFTELRTAMFGNPHSVNPSSKLTSEKVEEVRDMVLKFFNADPATYHVVFTNSATGALKMVGETFPWSENSEFRYLRENHNSVLGIREYALQHNGKFNAVDENVVASWTKKPNPEANAYPDDDAVYNLFAFPAEDNFAGVKYPLDWVSAVHAQSTPKNQWKVLIDASAYVPTQPLDLSKVSPDFVCMSFYKMFGYPTGLGALIVRMDASQILKKIFFGGGAVALATSKDNFHVLKCNPTERLEDGTVAYLNIIVLKHGFDMIEKLGGITKIKAHVASLTEWLYKQLYELRHSNRQRMLSIFGKHGRPDSREVQGGIINFEMFKPDGTIFSFKTFEREAAAAGFHVRTGAECNPGACYFYLGIKEAEIEALAGQKEGCDDDLEFITVERSNADDMNKLYSPTMSMDSGADSARESGSSGDESSRLVEVPLGSVRVSLGYMSTFESCYALLQFIKSYRDRFL